jgi:hypothetical protein
MARPMLSTMSYTPLLGHHEGWVAGCSPPHLFAPTSGLACRRPTTPRGLHLPPSACYLPRNRRRPMIRTSRRRPFCGPPRQQRQPSPPDSEGSGCPHREGLGGSRRQEKATFFSAMISSKLFTLTCSTPSALALFSVEASAGASSALRFDSESSWDACGGGPHRSSQGPSVQRRRGGIAAAGEAARRRSSSQKNRTAREGGP